MFCLAVMRMRGLEPLAGLLPSAVGEADPVSQIAAATAAANQFVKKKNRWRPDPQLGQDSPRRSAPRRQGIKSTIPPA